MRARCDLVRTRGESPSSLKWRGKLLLLGARIGSTTTAFVDSMGIGATISSVDEGSEGGVLTSPVAIVAAIVLVRLLLLFLSRERLRSWKIQIYELSKADDIYEEEITRTCSGSGLQKTDAFSINFITLYAPLSSLSVISSISSSRSSSWIGRARVMAWPRSSALKSRRTLSSSCCRWPRKFKKGSAIVYN